MSSDIVPASRHLKFCTRIGMYTEHIIKVSTYSSRNIFTKTTVDYCTIQLIEFKAISVTREFLSRTGLVVEHIILHTEDHRFKPRNLPGAARKHPFLKP